MALPQKAAGKKLLFVFAKVSQTSQKLTGLFLDFQAAALFNSETPLRTASQRDQFRVPGKEYENEEITSRCRLQPVHDSGRQCTSQGRYWASDL